MLKNIEGYEVGDWVVINRSDFPNFTIGKAYKIVYVGYDWVGLYNDLGEGSMIMQENSWCFYNREVSRHIVEE